MGGDELVERIMQAAQACPCRRRPVIGSQIMGGCERCDVEQLVADEIVRLRALITEWATALRALREVGLRYGNANWNRAYDRWDAIEKALFEEARREQ